MQFLGSSFPYQKESNWMCLAYCFCLGFLCVVLLCFWCFRFFFNWFWWVFFPLFLSKISLPDSHHLNWWAYPSMKDSSTEVKPNSNCTQKRSYLCRSLLIMWSICSFAILIHSAVSSHVQLFCFGVFKTRKKTCYIMWMYYYRVLITISLSWDWNI